MARDTSEYIDDYCYSTYGHFNWGYVGTYSKEEMKKDHDINGHIVYWHEKGEPDLPEGWSYCKECEGEFREKTPTCDCKEEIAKLTRF